MVKKKYSIPEAEIISLKLEDILTASTYVPHPEIPTTSGDEGIDGDL